MMHPNQRVVVALIFLNLVLILILYYSKMLKSSDLPLIPVQGNAPELSDDQDETTMEPTTKVMPNASLRISGLKIPKIIHFVIGLNESCNLEFYQYLAIKSAKIVAKPNTIYLHYYFKPSGKWLEKALSKKYITHFQKIERKPNEIWSVPVKRPREQKDLFRLLTLRQYGGIFLDLDIITLKSFDDLLGHEFVVGQYGEDGNRGLLPSFLMAQNFSNFLSKWLDEFKKTDAMMKFRLCCQVPRILSLQYPNMVHVLNDQMLYKPMDNHDGLKAAFYDRTYGYEDNYVAHLWAATTRQTYLRNLTAQKIWSLDTSLFCKLRNVTKDEDKVNNPVSISNPDACELFTKQGQLTREKGLAGRWTFQKLEDRVLPKIPESSGARMDGVLSPLNGYDLVHKNATCHPNYFSFQGGDHVYLPSLLDSSLNYYTFAFWLRLAENNSSVRFRKNRRSVILSLEYGDPANRFINLETISGRWILLNVEGTETVPVKLNSTLWYYLAIKAHRGFFSFAIEASCDETGSVEKEGLSQLAKHEVTTFPPLRGVWIGRQVVGKLNAETTLDLSETTLQNEAHFDMAYLELYDSDNYTFKASSHEQLCSDFSHPSKKCSTI